MKREHGLEPLDCIDVTREYFINIRPEHQLTIILNREPTDAELKGLKSVVKGNVNAVYQVAQMHAERNEDENR